MVVQLISITARLWHLPGATVTTACAQPGQAWPRGPSAWWPHSHCTFVLAGQNPAQEQREGESELPLSQEGLRLWGGERRTLPHRRRHRAGKGSQSPSLQRGRTGHPYSPGAPACLGTLSGKNKIQNETRISSLVEENIFPLLPFHLTWFRAKNKVTVLPLTPSYLYTDTQRILVFPCLKRKWRLKKQIEVHSCRLHVFPHEHALRWHPRPS